MADLDLEAFATRVNELREARGLSWKQLAARVGNTGAAMRRWKGGKSWPRTETLVALSRELGVTTDYLLLGRRPEKAAADFAALEKAIEATPRSLRVALCRVLLPKDSSRPVANDTHPRPERKV
jgi:transcriptional regulator with XRE-family HTH domain